MGMVNFCERVSSKLLAEVSTLALPMKWYQVKWQVAVSKTGAIVEVASEVCNVLCWMEEKQIWLIARLLAGANALKTRTVIRRDLRVRRENKLSFSGAVYNLANYGFMDLLYVATCTTRNVNALRTSSDMAVIGIEVLYGVK